MFTDNRAASMPIGELSSGRREHLYNITGYYLAVAAITAGGSSVHERRMFADAPPCKCHLSSHIEAGEPYSGSNAELRAIQDILWQAAGIPLESSGRIIAGAEQIRGFAGDPLTMTEKREIDGYQSRQLDRGVAYYKVGDIYSRPALFDTGRRIYINDDDRASIVTALRLMSERSGGRPVKPFGPPEFLAQVQRIADAEGIAVEIASPRQPITAKAQPFPMSASGDNEASALQNKAAVCEIATAMVAPAPVVAPNAPVVPRVVPIIPPVPPAIPEVAPVISPATSAVPAVAPDVPAVPRVVSSVAPVVSAEASIEPLAIRQDTESVKSLPTVSKIDGERPLGSALSEPSPVETLISMFCEAKTDQERHQAAAKIRSMPMAFAEMNSIGGELWKAEQRRFAELQRAQQWGQQGRGY